MLKKINELPEVARIVIILLCLVIGGSCIYGAVKFSRANESYTISETKKALENGDSFSITVKDEAEKEEIEDVIKKYNKKKGYEETDCYKMYKFNGNEYFVISDRSWMRGFSNEASDYYYCLGDMTSGIREEKGTFYFYYTNKMQEEIFLMSMEMSLISTDKLDIMCQEYEGEEVTVICITVEPKSNSEGAEQMSRAPFY